ncbi:type IV secretory system conjugative DNA transfer family protein [Pelomonas sp. APW6]|uniref:Type IV secretory system conjugative DNA transfer family protein n=1 Tax=Roseateles subflavus TaxID=3053353 RepID=A0ABT7LRJ5_9BURK|nr:type IV secretory system conjugative DNA transfer family protein [Pelomonas sp. APW6]MDL5034350.1 type IV secretory system conjugative DNA transfer family protein [Pelomonas sp. APW6]
MSAVTLLGGIAGFALLVAWSRPAEAQLAPAPEGRTSLSQLLNANAGNAAGVAVVRLSPVREAALGDTARALGAQAGLRDRSAELQAIISRSSAELDRRYRFSDLMMGVGILPAVISEARDAIAGDATVLRIAKSIYRIDEPARPVAIAPTWRDWLLVGLAADGQLQLPADPTLLPRDDAERAYWRQQVSESYRRGYDQADQVYALNLARLERTYLGMRRFYELYARGMVTAPTVLASSSVINREDPNTVAVGETVFRITAGTTFVDDDRSWQPLGK